MPLLTMTFLGLQISATVSASLFLKYGLNNLPKHSENQTLDLLFNIYIWLGLLCYACGFLLYVIVLKYLDLHFVQSMLALQYILIILGAVFLLNEDINLIKIVGMCLIACGIFVVGYAQRFS